MIKTIGIRREDKNKWERRVPIVPEDIPRLLNSHPQGRIFVQPSPIRIFPDNAYADQGAVLQEDLSSCDAVLGVKEMPIEFFHKGKLYIFFSHTIKGQKYNMPMLQRLIDLGCSLMDYERIVDAQNRRLVFFGVYAGLAGMMDTFWALGQRLAHGKISTPLRQLRMAHEYDSLEDAKKEIRKIGAAIDAKGLPKELQPLVVGFTGYGNVSRGAQEIFDLLPHIEITPQELLAGKAGNAPANRLVKVVFKESDTVRPKDRAKPFDLPEYFSHPDRYESTFRPYADHLTLLMNCIYWSPKNPMLLTKTHARELWGSGKPARLQVIGDISCDIEGGIEFTMKATKPDNPVFTYYPDTATIADVVDPKGPTIMSIDNLPCELSAEASRDFSKALLPLLPPLFDISPKASFAEAHLAPELKKATLLWKGKFTPEYEFMKDFLK